MKFFIKRTQALFRRLKIYSDKIRPTPATVQPTIKLKQVLKTLPAQDLENFLWLSTLEPDSPFNACTLAIIRQLNLQEAQESLTRLQESQLLTLTHLDQQYILHDSLRFFARHLLTADKNQRGTLPRLGIQWIEAHQKIIMLVQEEHDFLLSSHDIYFLKHLTWHLQEAQWPEQIHAVIDHFLPLHQWQNTIANTVFHQHWSLTALIESAQAEASEVFHQSPQAALKLIAKYGLMQNTRKLILQSIPDQWVRRLTEAKQWSPEQALVYLLSQTDSHKKAQSIQTLKSFLLPRYGSSILNIIDEIKLDSARSQGIVGVFDMLTSQEKKIALTLIQGIKSNTYRSLCISQIARHIPVPLMHGIYQLIEQIDDEVEQAKAIEGVLSVFTQPLQKQCLELIQTYRDRHLKIRLFSQLHEHFPDLKQDIFELVHSIDLDYSTLSIVWSLLDKPQQCVEQLLILLNRCPSDLDKVLFLSERALDADTEQFTTLWKRVCGFQRWQELIASEANEALWASMILSFMPRLSDEQIQLLVQEIQALNSPEVRGELCLQILPFVEEVEPCDELYQMIEEIEDIETRSKILVQALDYLPEAKTEILSSLKQITTPITKAEIQIHLLEHSPETALTFLQELRSLENEMLKAHLLEQMIDLVPAKHLPTIFDVIFDFNDLQLQHGLLQKLEPKLDIDTIKTLIRRLIPQVYPTSILRHTANQIHQNDWESLSECPISDLSGNLLSQLVQEKIIKSNTPPETLRKILTNSNPIHQSYRLPLCLRDIKWCHLDETALFAILKILSQGNPLEFIQNFSYLVQGIASVMGEQDIATYGNYCYQLSESSCSRATTPKSQNTEHTYHKFSAQEFSRQIA